jgi:hypothetical protein
MTLDNDFLEAQSTGPPATGMPPDASSDALEQRYRHDRVIKSRVFPAGHSG